MSAMRAIILMVLLVAPGCSGEESSGQRQLTVVDSGGLLDAGAGDRDGGSAVEVDAQREATTTQPEAGRLDSGAVDNNVDSGTEDATVSCSAGMVLCNGYCVAHDPTWGCGGGNCEPCPLPPTNSTATCSGSVCDFECNAGFHKSRDGSFCAPDCGKNANNCGDDEACTGPEPWNGCGDPTCTPCPENYTCSCPDGCECVQL